MNTGRKALVNREKKPNRGRNTSAYITGLLGTLHSRTYWLSTLWVNTRFSGLCVWGHFRLSRTFKFGTFPRSKMATKFPMDPNIQNVSLGHPCGHFNRIQQTYTRPGNNIYVASIWQDQVSSKPQRGASNANCKCLILQREVPIGIEDIRVTKVPRVSGSWYGVHDHVYKTKCEKIKRQLTLITATNHNEWAKPL